MLLIKIKPSKYRYRFQSFHKGHVVNFKGQSVLNRLHQVTFPMYLLNSAPPHPPPPHPPPPTPHPHPHPTSHPHPPPSTKCPHPQPPTPTPTPTPTPSLDKMAAISQTIFQMHFCEWKCLYFDNNSLKFALKRPIDNNPALVQIMVWRRIGDKPLSEPIRT